MNIHIALVGDRAEPILDGIRASTGVDKLYLLHSDRTLAIARRIRNTLLKLGLKDIFLRLIDAFAMNSVVNTIFKIAKDEGEEKAIFVNITGGTNLMAGAACAASFFIRAQAYYMLHPDKSLGKSTSELMIMLPIPHAKYKELTKLQINILRLLDSKSGPSSSKLLLQEGLRVSPQRLSYNIRELINEKLVEVSYDATDSRLRMLSLTHVGRLRLSWSS